jgi:hypothetical protein
MRPHRRGRKSSRVLTAIRANDTQDLRVNWGGVSELESMNSVPSWGCSNGIGCQTTSLYVAAVVCLDRGYTPNWRELYCVGISRQISLVGSHTPFQQLWPSFPVYLICCGSIGAVTPVTSAFVIEERKGKPPMMLSVGCL